MRRGRTLLELIVVLALLGMVAAIVAPALATRARTVSADDTARALLTRLGEARALAVQRGAAISLILDPRTGRLWVDDPDRDEGVPMAAGEVPLGGGVVIDAAEARVTFTFEPDGRAMGEPLRVRDGSRARVMRVDAWTGEATADAR